MIPPDSELVAPKDVSFAACCFSLLGGVPVSDKDRQRRKRWDHNDVFVLQVGNEPAIIGVEGRQNSLKLFSRRGNRQSSPCREDECLFPAYD